MITFICTFLQKLLECCHHLCSLYILRGCPKDADFFLKKGIKTIKDETRTYTAKSYYFLLKFAELKYQRQLWEESAKDLSEKDLSEKDLSEKDLKKAMNDMCNDMCCQNKARIAFV